ncbi:MAG: carboxypeptidase-like regulatory domain-containing protein [Candidatus Lutacidiplasmatales archaeon]
MGAWLLVIALNTGASSAAAPRADSTTGVLAITQSNYTTEQSNFTVSMQVANPSAVQFAYYTFCQLSNARCYLPIVMKLQGTNWFVGTTKTMSAYPGMKEGILGGYNITIEYAGNVNVTEPTLPNHFTNLIVGPSVSGDNYFEMTVRPQVFALSGVVHDAATGQVLSGAKLTLTPSNNTTATTDATGAYSIAGLTNGSYTLSVTDNGYQLSTVTVAIAGQDVVQNVMMSSGPAPPHSSGGFLSSPAGMASLGGGLLLVVVVAVLALMMVRKRKDGARPPVMELTETAPPSPPSVE